MPLWALRLFGLLSLLPASEPAEITVVDTPGSYSARFQAHWQLQLDIAACHGEHSPKRIHCLNGTTLANIKPLFDNVNCTSVTDSTMECIDTTDLYFVNAFSGVEYDCQGTILPLTRVEYASAISYCNHSAPKSVAHLLQLSVVCDNNETLQAESYVECADSNELTSLDGTYTCLSINTFDANETKLVPVPEVVMYTDDRWTLARPEGCFEFSPDASTSEPTLATTETLAAPTEAPASAAPFAIPEGTIYSVNYVGKFQQVLSEGCQNAAPGLVITCAGEIANVQTSDPSISCNVDEPITLDHNGRNAILCDNTCSDSSTDCEDVFRSTDAIGLGPVGQVFFECRGESTDDTGGEFIITEPPPGFCTGEDPAGIGYNLNVLQLGVSCPNSDGGRDYLVDDLHSDCGRKNEAIKVLGNYSCWSGMTCGAEPCQVEFKQLINFADPYRFPECVTTNNGSPVPDMTSPEVPDMATGTYTAQFHIFWFFLSDSSCIPGSPVNKYATCTNGNIRLIDSVVEGAPCAVISNTTIECSDTGLNGYLTYVSCFECPAAVTRMACPDINECFYSFR
jgi:hypothetical protein